MQFPFPFSFSWLTLAQRKGQVPQSPPGPPTFAQKRIVYFALLFGMTAYAIVAAIVVQANEGKGLAEEPIQILDIIAAVTGAALAGTAILTRFTFLRRAQKLSGDARAAVRFTGVLLPLALLEGGCLFAITVWMLNGNAVPSLAVALVLLALAIAIVPFSDPDAKQA